MNRLPPLFSPRPGLVRARHALAAALALLVADHARAASGVWSGSGSPLVWDDTANWAGALVADGAGFTADFSAADISLYTVVQLNSPRTIGNLIFGDLVPATPGSWNIGNNDVATNVLTLSGANPTITVPDLGEGQNASISANIAGAGGLTKAGAGTLISYGGKTYTGNTVVNAGAFVTTNSIPGGTDAARTALTIANGATLEFRAIYGDIQIRPSTITGAGTILKTGPGLLHLAGTPTEAAGNSSLALTAGGLIDVREGTLRLGNYNSQSNTMAGNLAAVVVAAGATLNIDSTNAIIGSLSGEGTVSGGYYGPRFLTIGTDNTSTTFSGAITNNAGLYNANASPTLVKTGTGALTLTGSVNIRSAFGQEVLTVNGGVVGSPSTLNLHLTGPSQIGIIESGGSGNGITFGNNEGDNVVVSQTAGTMTTPIMNVGRQGTTTYSLGGSAVANIFDLRLAETGPFTGTGAATLNLSNTAEVRVIAGGVAVMGQYYGRPVVVNQTGGRFGFYEDLAGTVPGGSGYLAFRSGNTAITYNLDGGTLSLPGLTRESGGGYGGGNAAFNLNGGTLQITSSGFNVPDGEANGLPFFSFNVGAGGVTVDPYGQSVNFNVPLRHAGAAALDGGLTLAGTNGGGTLTLSAANTYTGDTVVNSGSLVLASTGKLAFSLGANGAGTRLRGTGAATLDGALVVDRSGADLTDGNTWQLVANSTLNETYGATFSVEGFSGNAGVWTLTDGAYTWTFSQATGALVLDAPATATPYAVWADAAGLDGVAGRDPAATADPDRDGLNNLLEFALSGQPLAAEGGLTRSRVLAVSGTNYLTLTIAVRNGALFSGATAQRSAPVDGVTYTVEASTDLAAWSVPVVELTGTDAAALHASLPAPASGWSYRTFRTAAALATTPRVFLRARVE